MAIVKKIFLSFYFLTSFLDDSNSSLSGSRLLQVTRGIMCGFKKDSGSRNRHAFFILPPADLDGLHEYSRTELSYQSITTMLDHVGCNSDNCMPDNFHYGDYCKCNVST